MDPVATVERFCSLSRFKHHRRHSVEFFLHGSLVFWECATTTLLTLKGEGGSSGESWLSSSVLMTRNYVLGINSHHYNHSGKDLRCLCFHKSLLIPLRFRPDEIVSPVSTLTSMVPRGHAPGGLRTFNYSGNFEAVKFNSLAHFRNPTLSPC